ncbi:2-oxoglutarate dehydrogenase, E2 component, dihydrolipoamide succinyltransferase [Ruania halotolerans]|uniref:2-oxoglutarate dehydrogenase, E2 component, dihydrolipoamide succinyltransferase n=1 Tax=Ruania halotolerans TaxID=2897773 RepID=UPI001E3E39EC|nr:2-oxoglutarate dehydrogenase, E2 component, dihydrolipoamide succinyltransferase [Ruania halotolerans]UFU04849.1 2-oxoglutarate dehydrogenase, E2 component, dihydrolipoamide succinyltransferase [Ruania halotolerans]
MSQSVQMPALGESVTEGTVTRWLKAVGDTVEVDEPLLEVSTDKVDTEIPSPVAGVLEKILVEEDETVEVGADLAVVGSGEGASADDEPAQEESAPADEDTSEAAPTAEESADSAPSTDEASESAPSTDEAPAAEPEPEADAPAQSEDSGSGERTAVTLPALGESVTEGTVTQWLKSVGDTVEVDEPLLEVSTDKVDTEVPSPVAGTVLEILVGEDETVEVGGTLAYVGAADGASAPADAPAKEAPAEQESEPATEPETTPAPEPEPEPEAKAATEPEPEAKPAAKSEPEATPKDPEPAATDSSGSDTPYVTPLVRKLAADKGVDLAELTGTGVGGRVRKQDVLDAAEKAAAPAPAAESAPAAAPSTAAPKQPDVSPLRGTTEKMSRLRKIVAQRMVESLQTSAQLTTVVEVDVTKVARLRARAKSEFQAREGVKLTFLPFFTLAATEALKQFPKLNASIDGDEVVYHGSENVGIAVDTERGLVVPVIKEAGDLNIAGIARKIADLASRTRDNKATPDELGGGTFTITNTGSGGALFDTPILLQPQVGILGVGTIVKRPVVVTDADGGEVIAVRSMVYLALSYDHRLVDGADAARFLTAMKNRLEEGEFEAALGL